MFGEKEANAYIEKIFSGQFEPQTDEERGALQRLNQITAEMNKAQQEAAALAKRAEEMRALSNKLAGKREAYIEILVNTEMKRHATEPAPLSLVDLKEKIGADQIEARDNEGNLIETTKTTEEETDGADNGKPGREGKETSREPQSSRTIPPRC